MANKRKASHLEHHALPQKTPFRGGGDDSILEGIDTEASFLNVRKMKPREQTAVDPRDDEAFKTILRSHSLCKPFRTFLYLKSHSYNISFWQDAEAFKINFDNNTMRVYNAERIFAKYFKRNRGKLLALQAKTREKLEQCLMKQCFPETLFEEAQIQIFCHLQMEYFNARHVVHMIDLIYKKKYLEADECFNAQKDSIDLDVFQHVISNAYKDELDQEFIIKLLELILKNTDVKKESYKISLIQLEVFTLCDMKDYIPLALQIYSLLMQYKVKWSDEETMRICRSLERQRIIERNFIMWELVKGGESTIYEPEVSRILKDLMCKAEEIGCRPKRGDPPSRWSKVPSLNKTADGSKTIPATKLTWINSVGATVSSQNVAPSDSIYGTQFASLGRSTLHEAEEIRCRPKRGDPPSRWSKVPSLNKTADGSKTSPATKLTWINSVGATVSSQNVAPSDSIYGTQFASLGRSTLDEANRRPGKMTNKPSPQTRPLPRH